MTESTTTLTTNGIKCQGCATAARAAVDKLPGVKRVEFDIEQKTATVTHDQWADRKGLAEALTKAGFPSE